jgi:RES domain-containing protein
LSGEGARTHGGRFNPRGKPALYLALDLVTAANEASQGFTNRLIPPITIVSYEVDCDDIEDLTDLSTLTRLHVSAGDLNCAWKLLAETKQSVPSWSLVNRLATSGVTGIVVPSFAPGATRESKNLVLWRWGDDLPHRVRIFEPDRRLPYPPR